MNILHIAAEAYPISKSGGLGDVMGSLPKYQNQDGVRASLVIPFHESSFTAAHDWEVVYARDLHFGEDVFRVQVFKEATNALGFPIYMVQIPFIFPRIMVYGYQDDASRFIFFQIAVLYWLKSWEEKIDLIHCHDHHTGLIPFLCKNAFDFESLKEIPTVFTIHNGKYTGAMPWENKNLLPHYHAHQEGFLEYQHALNPMISAVKCAFAVTTVSEGYLQELSEEKSALGQTIREEWGKCKGILNGINPEEWSPKQDAFLDIHYGIRDYKKGKQANKEELLAQTAMKVDKPLFCFIGRMVLEKGADYLVFALDQFLVENKQANFYIIGSGDSVIMKQFQFLYEKYTDNVQIYLGYNEGLARKLYASADYLLMPSRVEPCGLNQMYAMRYGTIPVVRSTGGLRDTILPIEDGGNGFTFFEATPWELSQTLNRVLEFQTQNSLGKTIQNNMKIDFSWNQSVKKYEKLYQQLINM